MSKPISTHCFVAVKDYGFGPKHIVADIVHPITDKGVYGNKTEAELAAEYGAITRMTLDEYNVVHNQDWRRPPTPITAADFQDALEVLPPEDWVQQNGASTFKMSERMSGEMTNIYAQVDGVYYQLLDNAYLPHTEIVAMCRAAAK